MQMRLTTNLNLDRFEVHLFRFLEVLHTLIEPTQVPVVLGRLNVILPEGFLSQVERMKVKLLSLAQFHHLL